MKVAARERTDSGQVAETEG
jgi:hypothetical protein